LRVLFLSDFHYSRHVSLEMIDQAVRLGLAEQPELVLLGGDYLSFEEPLDFPAFGRVLSTLAARAPTFACCGNHDRKAGSDRNRKVTALLREAGVRVLCNQCEELAIDGREFELVGLGDWHFREVFPQLAFPKIDRGLPRLVLTHNPDCKELIGGYRWELMLCGHTHGGQVCMPWLGPLYAPVKGRRYIAGLNEWNGRQIYTTRGVGNLHGIRFNCRPEVTVLDLI
jgi:predicted MPP superfamily phosphohydrolase